MFSELTFPLGLGVDTYGPEATSEELRFARLVNLQPNFSRLFVPKALAQLQAIGGASTIKAIVVSTTPYEQISYLYAITDTSIYRFNFATNLFETTPIYTGFSNSEIYSHVSWFDKVYISKLNNKMVRLATNVATELPDLPSGRYAIASHNHLMLANVSFNNNRFPTRVQWSDLYDPENFTIDTTTDADFFDLEPGDLEITGLSYQRGNNLVYSRNSIWIANYDAQQGYRFNPLYTGIGNVFHGAQVSAKELDFFIGDDNIYILDGFQVQAIGDPIWKFFVEDRSALNQTSFVRSFYEPASYEVWWLYKNKASEDWVIAYNFKENKWSTRSPQGVVSSLHLPVPPRSAQAWDDQTLPFDDSVWSTNTFDGDWQFLQSSVSSLYGGSNGTIWQLSTSPASLSGFFETHDFFFGRLMETKEIDQAAFALRYEGTGDLALQTLEIGTRSGFDDPVSWSSAIDITTQRPGETIFHFRRVGVGRFIRFRFSFNNTNPKKLSELIYMSISVLAIEPDESNPKN